MAGILARIARPDIGHHGAQHERSLQSEDQPISVERIDTRLRRKDVDGGAACKLRCECSTHGAHVEKRDSAADKSRSKQRLAVGDDNGKIGRAKAKESQPRNQRNRRQAAEYRQHDEQCPGQPGTKQNRAAVAPKQLIRVTPNQYPKDLCARRYQQKAAAFGEVIAIDVTEVSTKLE